LSAGRPTEARVEKTRKKANSGITLARPPNSSNFLVCRRS